MKLDIKVMERTAKNVRRFTIEHFEHIKTVKTKDDAMRLCLCWYDKWGLFFEKRTDYVELGKDKK